MIDIYKTPFLQCWSQSPWVGLWGQVLGYLKISSIPSWVSTSTLNASSPLPGIFHDGRSDRGVAVPSLEFPSHKPCISSWGLWFVSWFWVLGELRCATSLQNWTTHSTPDYWYHSAAIQVQYHSIDIEPSPYWIPHSLKTIRIIIAIECFNK